MILDDCRTRDEIIVKLRGQGIGLPAAERFADEELRRRMSAAHSRVALPCGPESRQAPACVAVEHAAMSKIARDHFTIEQPPVPLEDDVQRAVVEMYEKAGCVVYSTSQKRASRVSEGIPDLFVFDPVGGHHFWHEVKRPGGELRPEQATFRDLCLRTGESHITGGVEEARAALTAARRNC